MKINTFRLAGLLITPLVLGGVCYKEYANIHNPATVYVVPSGDLSSWLEGEWTVDDLAGATRSTQIAPATALSLVGKMAQIRTHEFAFDDMNCHTEFTKSIEQPLAFFQDYGATPFTLHMHMPSTRIDAGCADLFPLAHDTIFISYEGYFLEAIRRQQQNKRTIIHLAHDQTLHRRGSSNLDAGSK